jgi:hypothetical protein
VVEMQVREEDRSWICQRTREWRRDSPVEGTDLTAQDRVGDQPRPVELDQRGRVAEKLDAAAGHMIVRTATGRRKRLPLSD